MQAKLVIWDFNGTLLNDLECFYNVGVCYIFRHFGLNPPSLETYRNDAPPNFIEFYHTHGVPTEFSLDALDLMVDESRRLTPYEAHLFPDVLPTLEAFRQQGIEQVIVSGCPQLLLQDLIALTNIQPYFTEIIGAARQKQPFFRQLLADRGLTSSQAIGITDTDGDAFMLDEVGITPYVCARGFHGPQRLQRAKLSCPRMEIVPDLTALLERLG